MGRRPYAEREVETPLGSEIYRLQKIKLTYEAGGQEREEGGQDAGHCDGQVYHTMASLLCSRLEDDHH